MLVRGRASRNSTARGRLYGAIVCLTKSWSSSADTAADETLRARGYHLVGLDSTGDLDLADAALRAPLALVLGAEGKGLRQLTRATCDQVARLGLPGRVKSLNVSNAAALALHVASRRAS